jgi:hypothetical protein
MLEIDQSPPYLALLVAKRMQIPVIDSFEYYDRQTTCQGLTATSSGLKNVAFCHRAVFRDWQREVNSRETASMCFHASWTSETNMLVWTESFEMVAKRLTQTSAIEKGSIMSWARLDFDDEPLSMWKAA